MKHISALLIGCLVLIYIAGCRKPNAKDTAQDPIIGVKIYDHNGQLPQLFKMWRELGINTVFASEALNTRREFQFMSKKYHITRFVIVPIFYDPEALKTDPGLYAITDQGKKAIEEWVEFVCPSREDFRKKKIAAIKRLIQELDPDGLSLDFIRHFVFWEKVYPERTLDSLVNTCFDRPCMDNFQAETGILIPEKLTSPAERAEWIKANCLEAWTDWKCSLVTNLVKVFVEEAKRIKPDILINVHTLPWRQKDLGGAIKIVAGQDFTQISAHTDYLSPMTYAHMVRRPPSWIHSVVTDIARITNCRILPSIQVKKAYLSEDLAISEFKDSLLEALKPPSSGVVFWNWESLVQDVPKMDVIREVSQKRR